MVTGCVMYSTYAAAGLNPNHSVDQAYNFFATRDLGQGKFTITIITVISIVTYLTDKGEHTALYKINKNVFADIKTAEIIIS